MFFTVSKVFFFFAQPSSLIVFLIAAGGAAWLVGLRRTGRWLAGIGVALFLLPTATPLGMLFLSEIENRFPRPAADVPAPEGIVLLGGFTNARMLEARGVIGLGDGTPGVFEVAELAKRWPGVPIVLAGGSNGLISQSAASEAELMKRLLVALGVAPERLVLEDASRTTWENAIYSRDLVKPRPGARWELVTTAFHMPRAMAAFRAAGWTGIVARPSAYMTDEHVGLRPPMLWGLIAVDVAVKEWLGIVGYRLTGRAKELLPRP